MEKICSSCGARFSCGQGAACWCEEVSLTPSQLTWLRERVENCLCRRCLSGVSHRLMGPGDR